MGFNSSLKTDCRDRIYLLLLQQVYSITRNSESSKPLSRKSLINIQEELRGGGGQTRESLNNVRWLRLVVGLQLKLH